MVCVPRSRFTPNSLSEEKWYECQKISFIPKGLIARKRHESRREKHESERPTHT